MIQPLNILRKLFKKPATVPPDTILKVEDTPGLTDKDKILLKRIGVTGDELAGRLQEDLQINYERRSLYKEFDKARDHWMVGAALGLFADVVTTPNALQNATVWIVSESSKYVTELTKLLDRIGMEERIYDWAWTTGCYGDHFPKINGQPGLGVVSIEDGFHPVDISRLDYDGVLVGFYLTPQGGLGSSSDEQKLLPPWEYVHLRMLGSKKKRSIFGDPNFMEYRTIHLMAPDTRQVQPRYGMYGTSLLMDALPVWKRLRLAEDSLLMARLTRGITKYIYKIKVDSSSMEAVSEMIDQYVTILKRARAIDTGSISGTPAYDSKWNAMSSMEDIILPVWGDAGDITIDKIGGETDIRWIVDITELRNQLASSLRAPVPLLGGHIEEAVGAMGGEALSKLDIRFARTARKLQRAVKEGITRICQIHLAYMNMDPDPNLFEVNLSETSTAEDEQLRDALDKGVDVIDKYMQMFDTIGLNLDKAELFNYMNQKILKLNDLDLKDYIKSEPTVEEFRERCCKKLSRQLFEKMGTRKVDKISWNRDFVAALPLKSSKTRYGDINEWKKQYGECKVKLTESTRKKEKEKEN